MAQKSENSRFLRHKNLFVFKKAVLQQDLLSLFFLFLYNDCGDDYNYRNYCNENTNYCAGG